ncbi:MAG: BtaA family protein [Planctomycetota bacterium]
MAIRWVSNRAFNSVHRRNLVYNTCWEDPRLDRKALQLTDQDTVVMITSAGCNALDYALEGPAKVIGVDMNPLQNALLDLKLAAIKTLEYDDFFQIFGRGHHSDWRNLYRNTIRHALDGDTQAIWDKRIDFFDGSHRRSSFYFRGTSGLFAWLMNRYLNRPKGLREAVNELLDSPTIEAQREIYERRNVEELLWTRSLRWALKRDMTMAMLGVPRSQRNQIDRTYPGGLAQFIQDRIAHVFREIPLHDNYFWRVYLTGEYTPTCCPEYLKPEGFEKLKGGMADRVETHTNTVEGFLRQYDGQVTRFVLLDHMDWLYDRKPELLASEWQAIVDRASSSARVLWRSAAMEVDFVDPIGVQIEGRSVRLGDLLTYHGDLATDLHQLDRVQTYGSFYIADLGELAA